VNDAHEHIIGQKQNSESIRALFLRLPGRWSVQASRRALLTRIPMLAKLIERETADSFDLSNGTTIEVHPPA